MAGESDYEELENDSRLDYEVIVERFQQNPDKFSYEDKIDLLDRILQRLDNAETPIDDLARDVKLGTRIIKELKAKLTEVETEVKDAFKELEDTAK